jgi:SAM-dependent methyltransferase
MFQGADLLEFGSGTGEHSLFYLKYGAKCTFVEMNELAIQREEMIFKHFGIDQSQYKIYNKSLFDTFDNNNSKYDIVVSMGVIHHTNDKELAFDIKCQYLKEKGFLILGIGNVSGVFQRNLQRAILYQLSDSDDDIERFAEELFHEDINRAEKFGKRSRKAIIYDNYVNPKHDMPSISEVLSWFNKNNLLLYSAYPPIVPAIIGDSAVRNPVSYQKLSNIMSIAEIIWMMHRDDDIVQMSKFDTDMTNIVSFFKDLAAFANNVSKNKPLTNIDEFADRIESFLRKDLKINPYEYWQTTAMEFLYEVQSVIVCIKDNRIDKLKKTIKNLKHLFRGTSGLGISYFIGYKN